ncbi:MAG: sigma-70 family RNA polymerase sigma factor [Patescibacteria group bacterium]
MACYSDLSDEELVQAARRNDRAFAEIIRRYRNLLAKRTSYYVGEDDCDDLLQETWLKIKLRLNFFDPAKGTLKAWVHQINRNLINRFLRDRYYHKMKLNNFANETKLLGDLNSRAIQTKVADRLTLRKLLAQLEQADPGQYEAITSSRLDEMSYREISALVGVSEVALRSRVHRGIERLQQIAMFGPDAPK